MDKPVVKELIQDELNETNLVEELNLILFDENTRERIQADYAALKSLLSKGGHASDQAAAAVVELAAANAATTL
jgi:lipid-A-disaccharide synthase